MRQNTTQVCEHSAFSLFGYSGLRTEGELSFNIRKLSRSRAAAPRFLFYCMKIKNCCEIYMCCLGTASQSLSQRINSCTTKFNFSLYLLFFACAHAMQIATLSDSSHIHSQNFAQISTMFWYEGIIPNLELYRIHGCVCPRCEFSSHSKLF